MATAILRSHDLLPRYRFDSQTTTSFPFRSGRNPNPNPNPIPNTIRPRRRKRSPVAFNGGDRNRGRDRTMVVKFPSKNLVLGQVKILKRGEDLDRAFDGDDDDDLVLSSTDRLGPDPETVQKQIRVSDLKVVDGLYAGSAAFFASPPPSSLPFPAFFAKKEKNDVATNDLRRLLRLDDC